MNPIHQLYATHCTYGSSALEQREGELAARVLGYSARAGSLDRAELRNCYRQVERFLYYYLPTDTPTEEKLRLEASTAPRRMFFCPSLGELQVLGQISYRQQDTAGRPGSYFGHVLFGRRAEGAWPALDCLKLWAAPWAEEDSPDLAANLATLKNLDELLDGKRPAIDDAVLLSFLKTPPGAPFDDPAKIIPERWNFIDPARRSEVLTETLQGFLNLGSQRRENLLLVVEPAVAALVFYGVARLLPPGAVRDGISFSTFEPNADRIPVSLAATTFHAPESTDLRPEAYRRRGYVHNTFLDRHSDHGCPEGLYGRLLVDVLLVEGFAGVDRLLSGFQAAGANTAEDVELLADVHRLVPQVLDSEAPLGETRWRQSDVAVRYLSLAVHRQLANDEAGWPQLRGLIGSPNQLLVMELIASAPDAADIQAPLQYLLRKLAPEKFGELLASARLPRAAKVEALAFHLSSVGQFPEHCEMLWNEGSRVSSIVAGRAEPLLPGILGRLPAQTIGPLYRTLPPDRSDAFLRALLHAGRPEPELQAAQRAVAAGLFKEMDDERLVAWLLNQRDALRNYFPPPEDVLRPRLARLLFEIPDHPQQIEARLNALEGWVDYFSEPSLAERRITQWRKIRSVLLAIRDAEQGKPSNRLQAVFRRAKPADYRGLAEALNSAMPMNVYQDDMRGTKKLECLKGLGQAILGRGEFLSPVVRSRMLRYFEYGDWSEFSGSRKGKRGKGAGKNKSSSYGQRRKPSAWRSIVQSKLFAFGGGALLVVLAGLGYAFFRTPAPKQLSGNVVGPGKKQAAGAGSAADAEPAAGQKPAPAVERSAAAKSDGGSSEQKAGKPEQKPATEAATDKMPGETPKKAAPAPAAAATKDEPVPENASERPAPSDADAPAPSDATTAALPPKVLTVADCKALPSLETNKSAAYQRVDLITWDVRPANCKLALRGVEFANAAMKKSSPQIKEPVELTYEARGEELIVSARITGASSATVPLGTFSLTEESLCFQWHELTNRSVALTWRQNWLRACVLEIQNGTDSKCIALCRPLRMAPLHLSNGTAPLSLTHFSQQYVLPERSFEFRLARGELRLHDDRVFEIEADADSRRSANVVGLGEAFGLKAVRLALEHDATRPDGWAFKLAPEAAAETLELQQQYDDLEAEVRQFDGPIGRFRAREATNSDKAGAARELEQLLGRDLSSTAEKTEASKPPPPADAHASERRIVEKADQRRRTLQRQLAELGKQLKQKQSGKADMLVQADSISAVLYRVVDESIRVESVIIGEPGAAPDKRAGENDAPDKNEGTEL